MLVYVITMLSTIVQMQLNGYGELFRVMRIGLRRTGMHNSNYKPTKYLIFLGLARGDGGQATIVQDVDRRQFLANRNYFRTSKKYCFEGNEMVVMAKFVSDVFDAPGHDDALAFVVAWFDGRFERRNLYDVM